MSSRSVGQRSRDSGVTAWQLGGGDFAGGGAFGGVGDGPGSGDGTTARGLRSAARYVRGEETVQMEGYSLST